MSRRTLKIAPDLALPLDVVTRRTAILGQTDTGKTSTAVVLVEEAAAAGAQFVVVDPTDAWYGLSSSADGKGAGVDCVVMGGPHGDVPLDERSGRLIARLVADEAYSLVACLDALGSWNARQRFVADLCAELYERAHSQILVVIDEAHRFAPQTARDAEGHAARCQGAVTDVVLLGRRKGLATIVVSQRPARLHKDVLEMSEILIAHRLRGNNDRKALKGWVEEVDLDVRDLLTEVGGLKKGVARISAPTLGINGTYTIRPKRTFDSSKSIGPGETAVEPKKRASINLDELNARMAETIERAKAEDPKELRKQIRDRDKQIGDLRRELEKRPTETKVETVTETVEVPAVSDQVLEQLGETVEALSAAAGKIVAATNETSSALAKVTRRRDAPAAPAVRPPQSPPRAAAAPARPSPAAPADEDFRPTPAQQRILNALAALEAIGVGQPSKVQLALFAEASPKSSGYTNNLGALRTAGLITYPAGGLAALTDAGRAWADDTDAPSSVEELLAYVRQLVGPSKAKIIDAVVDVYPDALPKGELADRAGASASSSGYTNNLGSLRSLGLIDYPQPGYVVATPVLFLEAA